MRIGFRLFWGFGLMLLLIAALVAVGWEGERRLADARSVLERRAGLEAEIRTLQSSALAFMLDPKPGAINAVLAGSGEVDQTYSVLKMHVEHDMGVRLDRAMRANVEFRGAIERWQSAADARAASVVEAENAAAAFTELFEELTGKKRDAAFLHQDGYASAELVNTRLSELRAVNDIQRDLYEARLLSKEWVRGGDAQVLGEIRTRMGSAMASLSDVKSRMTSLSDKDMADTLLAHGRDYLAALSQLEDSTTTLNDVKGALSTAVSDMREPMKLLADRYQAEVDYVQDIMMLSVAGIAALGLFIALVFGLVISGGVRKRLGRVRDALESLANGACPARNGSGVPEDMGPLLDVVQQVAMSQSELADRVQQLTAGADVEIGPRSANDVLGTALGQLADAERKAREALLRNTEGDFATLVASRETSGGLMQAVDAQNRFVAAQVAVAQHSAGALRELAGQAMQIIKTLEQRFAAAGEMRNAAGLAELADIMPRIEAACSGMRSRGDSVQPVLKDIRALHEATERLGATFKQLMGRASFSEDVARRVEALAINVNIEAARATGDRTGLQAIVTELRAVVEHCRENAADVNESLYVGRRASDDVSAGFERLQAALDGADHMATGGALLESDMALLRSLARPERHGRVGNYPQAVDAELQKLASSLGKVFGGLVMELNTLNSGLEPFRIGNVPPRDVPRPVQAQAVAQEPAQDRSAPVRSMPPLRLGRARGRDDLEDDDL